MTTRKYIHYDIATLSPLILSNSDLDIGPHSCNEQNVCVCVKGEYNVYPNAPNLQSFQIPK